jgi:tripartite-type tricarboxylate transporter receptor subunit TctC
MDLPITLSRRDALVLGLAAAASPAAAADNYPSRTVTIVAPSEPGGPVDAYSRSLADELRKALHQTVLVRNQPGAGTTLATNLVAHAAPDGYTLLTVADSQTVSETLYVHKPYQLMRDLTVVAALVETDMAFVVHPSVPARNLQQLLALVRDKPGQFDYGSAGFGSSQHMAAELLKQITGIDIVHFPANDSSAMRSDLVRGETQILFDVIPALVPAIRIGSVRVLATTGEQRSPILPDAPTFAEAGVDFQMSLWLGMMAPKATPQPVIDLLNKTISGIITRPDFKDQWAKQGGTPMLKTRADCTTFIQREIDKWATVIKTNHIALIN